MFARVVLALTKLAFLTPSSPHPSTTPGLYQAGYGEVRRPGMGLLDKVLARVVAEEGRRGLWRKRVERGGWGVFAAGSWGAVMWLFRWYPESLQPSLRSSMRYLYENAEKWDGVGNWVWHNT